MTNPEQFALARSMQEHMAAKNYDALKENHR